MAEIIISVAAKVAEYLVAPIGRQLSYVFSYRSYLDDLKNQVEQLNDAMTGRQREVDEAKTQGYDIEDDVQKWLTDTAATKIQTARKFIEDEEASNRSCFNVKSRYQRSREAKKQTRDIEEEIKKNNFSRVSCQRPPQRKWSTCLRGIETFKSREDTLNQIMEALKSDDIKLIGVWGMGGVGKTTLAKHVMKLAEEDKLFDMVVMASNISQFPNVSKIQVDIADMLGLKFDKDETERVRADRLRTRLNNHKRLLVILDDLWEELRLDQIGIPYGRDGCKVLLTSRKRDLLSKAMETQKNFEVKQLSEEEAWSLFKTNAGDAVENLELRRTARQVADKCDGLPVAITTIAKALRGESSVAVWKNALDELERCEPTNIEGVSNNVYSCLELSYKHLKGDEVKRLFLLCAMLGSSDIFKDRLLQYAMSLDVFQHNLSLEQATNKLVTLVNILKDASLLLDTEGKYIYLSDQLFFEPDEIKIGMHDVVRDVARSIASKDLKQLVLKEAGGFEEWQSRDDELINCTHISLSDPHIKRLPERLVCPKLEFFFLKELNYPRCLKIPDTFFEEMKQLKVLHLHHVDLLKLPSSLDAMSNLQTLSLTRCYLGDVAIIGALKQLRVLSFQGSNIQQLSEEMMQLSDLRVLDLSYCRGLRVIPRNVISSLSRLEYLCVGESFTKWGSKRFDNEGATNACLSELTNLSNLKILVINAENLNLLPEDVVFQKLNRYRIVVGNRLPLAVDEFRYSRVLKLNGINSRHDLVNCFSKLLKTTQLLQLKYMANGKRSLCEYDGEGFPKLKHLFIEESAGIQYVVNSMEWAPSRCAFPILESLDVERLTNLDAVWYGPIPKGSFGRIRDLRLSECRSLKSVMLLSTAHEGEFEFPHLEDILLEGLPEFIYFCSTETSSNEDSSTTNEAQTPFFDQKVALPRLEFLRMVGLDKVRTVWQDQLQAGSFRKLKGLELRECPTMQNVFTVSVAKGLENLEVLRIADCEVEEIVANENGEGATPLLFPKLASLGLNRLGKLRRIYGGTSPGVLEWPLLKDLEVCYCGKVEIVFQGVGSEAEADLNHLSAPPPLFFVQKGTFANLEKLTLTCTKKIWQGQFSNELFGKLEHLEVRECNDISIVISSTIIPVLSNVKHLSLKECNSVEELFQVEEQLCLSHPSGPGSILKNLSSLKVSDCKNLMYLLTPSMAKTRSVQLEEFTIQNCSKAKEIVCIEANEATDDDLVFPKLEKVKLRNLPNLRCLGSSRYPLKFPSLTKMTIAKCPAMESFCGTFSESTKLVISMLPQLTQLCMQISGLYQNLQNIQTLVVRDCENLMYLVTPSMAKSLVQLKELKISGCSMMTEVVGSEGDDTTYEIIFPKLEILRFYDLPKLKGFCSTCRYTFNFPSLKEFDVDGGNEMEFFCGGALTAPRLVKFNYSKLEGDLNTAIRKRALEKRKISVREEDAEEHNSEEEDFEGGDSRGDEEFEDMKKVYT